MAKAEDVRNEYEKITDRLFTDRKAFSDFSASPEDFTSFRQNRQWLFSLPIPVLQWLPTMTPGRNSADRSEMAKKV